MVFVKNRKVIESVEKERYVYFDIHRHEHKSYVDRDIQFLNDSLLILATNTMENRDGRAIESDAFS
jgi:hypothetical protein